MDRTRRKWIINHNQSLREQVIFVLLMRDGSLSPRSRLIYAELKNISVCGAIGPAECSPRCLQDVS